MKQWYIKDMSIKELYQEPIISKEYCRMPADALIFHTGIQSLLRFLIKTLMGTADKN
jgi:hypothetical protein